jgi:hypothetical protein
VPARDEQEAVEMAQDHEQGVQFPAGEDGRRSTASTGRAVWAEAVRGVDDDLAGRIERAPDWRKEYVDAVAAHTAAATRSPEAAVRVARQGLAALDDRMRFERDGAISSVAQAVQDGKDELRSETVLGQGEQERELVLPYRGEELRGDALRRQVDTWVARGTFEPSCGQALHRVLDSPDWLDVGDRSFALLGAGAEMGPLEPLLRWGAHVVAVDVPKERIWDRLRRRALVGAGTLTLPLSDQGAGVDLLTQTPELATFLRGAADGLPLTIGSYAYADGARHVQVAHASDSLVELLLRERPGTSYAELATPTDAFAVPQDVVEDSRRRWAGRGWRSAAQAPARLATRGALYASAYDTDVVRDDGTPIGIADVLVPQQGPNYTLAKRLQRWRATAAQAEGHLVSANVAPATRTRSVTKNRLLAAAYAGAGRFGVEVFAPQTSRVLMAALLVHDLRAAAPVPAHPDDLFATGAAHGGLWRVAYSPRSVLGLAALTGLPGALLRR